MVAGHGTKAPRNEAFISATVEMQKQKLRSLTTGSGYGRVLVEYVVQDGAIQCSDVTVKEQNKVTI